MAERGCHFIYASMRGSGFCWRSSALRMASGVTSAASENFSKKLDSLRRGVTGSLRLVWNSLVRVVEALLIARAALASGDWEAVGREGEGRVVAGLVVGLGAARRGAVRKAIRMKNDLVM